MKTKIFIATIVAAALGAGFYLIFTSIQKTHPPIPKFDTQLVGKWKINTAYNTKDSNSITLVVAALAKDSGIVQFNADSTLQTFLPKDTTVQNYYLRQDTLFVKKDSTYETMQVRFVNDSVMHLISKDSTVVHYSKIK